MREAHIIADTGMLHLYKCRSAGENRAYDVEWGTAALRECREAAGKFIFLFIGEDSVIKDKPGRIQEGNKVLIEVRSFKIIEVPADPPYPSSIDVLEDPPLSTVVQFWYEY